MIDSAQLDCLLQPGYRGPTTEFSEEAVDYVRANDLAEIEERTYVKCARKMDPDYDDLSDASQSCDGRIPDTEENRAGGASCPECGRFVFSVGEKRTFRDLVVGDLNRDGIVKTVVERLQRVDIVDDAEVIRKAVVNVVLEDGREMEVVFPRFALTEDAQRGLFFDTPTLFLHANDVDFPNLSAFGEKQHMTLADMLVSDLEDLNEEIDTIAVTVPRSVHLTETRALYDAAIDYHRQKSNHGEYLEQALQELLRRIVANPETFEDYLRLNRRLEGTIYDRIVIDFGKQGTDVHCYPKSEFLGVLQTGKLLAECKCYGKDNPAGVSAVDQANGDRRRNRDTITYGFLIVDNDHITYDAWREMVELKRLNGGVWEIMIFPIAIFLELIHVFEAEDILRKRLVKQGKRGWALEMPA